MSDEGNRVSFWDGKWNDCRDLAFHLNNVDGMLEKHIDKLTKKGKLDKMFVPLCGKAVDMKHLADQGINVVGVDVISQAVTEFFEDNDLERVDSPVPSMGPDAYLAQTKDGKIKIYCGDILLFNESLEGKFDAIWDRGSIVALNRSDVISYAQLLKRLLKPNGKVLLEVMVYDTKEMNAAIKEVKYPPPHPMSDEEIRDLFEPECSVDLIDEGERRIAITKCKTTIHLITKK